jgi:hypothetical protein
MSVREFTHRELFERSAESLLTDCADKKDRMPDVGSGWKLVIRWNTPS